MIKIKKFRLLIAFVSLLLCISLVQDTYAKYINSVNGNANLTIARWKIVVNNDDISDGAIASENITPVFAGTQNIASDVIAPTSVGYFDIAIQSAYTDVGFNYQIKIEPSITSNVQDLVTTGYSINGGEVINFENYNEDIVGYIQKNAVNTTTIRVYVLWNDSATQTMDNAADTLASISEVDASMNVTLHFTQAN